MDALKEALQRLTGALSLKDSAAQANRMLGRMTFPQLSSLLPYRNYDRDSALFMNSGSLGFLLQAQPLCGANEHIVQVLDDLVKTRLPRETTLSFHLVSTRTTGLALDRGLADFSWQGPCAERFNRITRAFWQRAALGRFSSPMNLPLTLRDYRLYIAFCRRTSRHDVAAMTEMMHFRKVLCASLEAARLPAESVNAQEFVRLLRLLINQRPDQLYEEAFPLSDYDELNRQCVQADTELLVMPDSLRISHGRRPATRVMNFQLAHNPELFFLWQGGDSISSLLSPDLSINSPFVMTFMLEAEDQVRSQNEATRKFLDLDRKASSPYARLFPAVTRQAREWGELRERLNTSQSCIVRYFFNITTFCADTDEDALVCEQQVVNTFRKNGIALHAPRYMQMRNWLAMLPFTGAEGLWSDIRRSGATCRAESTQAVNLLPVVTDNRLCGSGLPVPSYRNQLAFLDIYATGLGNTNYNMAVTGTAGAGKTGLVQPILRSVLDAGGVVWVFDMGDGYRSFCENAGGVYLDGTTLKFNPFASVSDIRESAERIRDQLAVLASPNGTLDEVHEDLLLKAVMHAWESKQRRARIDDVVAWLEQIRHDKRYRSSAGITGRMDEIIELLGKYTTTGIYGDYFNSDEPSIGSEARLVVLELGGLQDKPALLAAVMFSLIIHIENCMYRSPRNQKKCCTIDEGWKLLNFKNEKVSTFIETGYRTARKHMGSFITISQNIKDFDAENAPPAAKAAFGNSSFKVVMKQDAAEFKNYCQHRPNQFTELERQAISRFGDAKDQWFSSFMLRINDISSFHRLFVDPLSRAMFSSRGVDFEFIRERRRQGMNIHEAVEALAWHNFPQEMRELDAMTVRQDGE